MPGNWSELSCIRVLMVLVLLFSTILIFWYLELFTQCGIYCFSFYRYYNTDFALQDYKHKEKYQQVVTFMLPNAFGSSICSLVLSTFLFLIPNICFSALKRFVVVSWLWSYCSWIYNYICITFMVRCPQYCGMW
jgi:hypothetical protein